MSLSDIFNASEIKAENEKLKSLFNEIGAFDYAQVKDRIGQLKLEEEKIHENTIKNRNDLKTLEYEITQKKNAVISLDELLMLESFALYTPHFSFQTSDEYSQRLDAIRDSQKQMIKSSLAATGNQEWTVNGSKADGKKMVNDMIKLVLRSFNNECDYCVDNVKFNNIESSEKRINTSYDALDKLGKLMHVSISPQYKKLKIDELYLAFEYQRKKQDEKEELRRLKEELKEQQKLEHEIEVARAKIAKDKKHYSIAIEEINQRLAAVTNDNDRNELNLKLEELMTQSKDLEQEEKLIDYREQNAKAGYVYIISNIGAFGENIYKIGMTRRLEPTERVYELGDASVPFPFDIHALIFSNNAPELEAKIQNRFHSMRLNKINNRKEFFRADINEIEKVVKENYDKVLDLIKNPPAEQYRESLLIKE